MKRCPTVPVAPRIATLRLRIVGKFDVSGGRRGEPPVPVVDPMAQPEAGSGQIGERLVVIQHVPAVDADPPVPAVAAVVLDGLRDERTLSTHVSHADWDTR